MHDEGTFDLKDLCDRTGVTARTVRYYVQQGLLPSPGAGLGARYGREHLDRLQLIRGLQKQHLPLAEIRRQLESLDPAALRSLQAEHGNADASPPSTQARSAHPAADGAPAADSAVDYVRSVLQRRSPSPSSSPAPSTGASSLLRSQWERITLSADIELHVRRPLSRDDHRRVERLIDEARRIVTEA
jgi:DNA-binding transcriptional MerR regulator